MKIIDVAEFKDVIANNDIVMLKEKDFINNNNFFNQKYAEIYSKYRYGLEIYLNSLLNIEDFDNDLCNNKYMYDVILDDDKDFYQRNNFLPFKYIYLRNNLYIERLSHEDIKKIHTINVHIEKEMNLLLEIVKKTYPIIIAELGDSNALIQMGRNSNDLSTFVKNKTITYGIRYDEFTCSKKSGDKWLDNFFDQHEHLNRLVSLIKEQIYQRTGLECNFIFFNNYNV